MKTCNSCVYHYADRSGSVCNALHAFTAVEQAKQCHDYKLDSRKQYRDLSIPRAALICYEETQGRINYYYC